MKKNLTHLTMKNLTHLTMKNLTKLTQILGIVTLTKMIGLQENWKI